MPKECGYCFQCDHFADPFLETNQPLKGRCILNPPVQIDFTGLAQFPLVTALTRCRQFSQRAKNEQPMTIHPLTGNSRELVDRDATVAVISALDSAMKSEKPQAIFSAYYGRFENE